MVTCRIGIMDSLHDFISVYLLIVNLAAFAMFGIDKYKAKEEKWRISEFSLFAVSFIGGSFGAWMGMNTWRHKTRHKKFVYGLPLLFVLQVVLIFCLHRWSV